MFCTTCGAQLEDGARFCNKCGSEVAPIIETPPAVAPAQPVPAEPVATQSAPMQPAPTQPTQPAPVQAAPVTPSVQAAPVAPSVQPTPRQKSSKRTIGIAVACVVVVVAVVVGIFAWQSGAGSAMRIDEATFPNDIIRTAIEEQLDADGNGVLEPEEAETVTAVVYTPVGAQFVQDGKELDVQATREAIYKQANVTEEQAQKATQDAASNPISNPIATPKGKTPFNKIQNIVMEGSGLTEIDLSPYPELTYVDLRGNNIDSLDLSHNGNLTTLYCEPTVTLTGLEEAGLYFTDLLTSETRTYGDETSPVLIEYDTMGRPVKAGTKVFEYDDQGRVVKSYLEEYPKQCESFSYNEAGQLATWINTRPLGTTAISSVSYYGYGANGYLDSATYTNDDYSSDQGSVYEVGDGLINSTKADEGYRFYTYDTQGNLTKSQSQKPHTEWVSGTNATYGLENGVYSSRRQESFENAGLNSVSEFELSLDDQGAPTQANLKMASASQSCQIESNQDGYITKITWGQSNNPSYVSNRESTFTYVKRVGSLADRTALRNVPVFRLTYYDSDNGSPFDWANLKQDLYRLASHFQCMKVVEWQPQNLLAEAMGINPQVISNANERMLAAYDREHWLDGVNHAAGAQPITGTVGGGAVENAKELPNIASPQAIASDPVYGPVYDALCEVCKSTDQSIWSRSPYIDGGLTTALTEMLMYSNGDASKATLALALCDINGDGTNELLVTSPHEAFYESKSSDTSNKHNVVYAIYGNVGGEAQLFLSGFTRSSLSILADGRILHHGSGGMDIGSETLYSISSDDVAQDKAVSWEPVSMDNRGKSSSSYKLTFEENGREWTETVSYKDVNDTLRNFIGSIDPATIGWTLCLMNS